MRDRRGQNLGSIGLAVTGAVKFWGKGYPLSALTRLPHPNVDSSVVFADEDAAGFVQE